MLIKLLKITLKSFYGLAVEHWEIHYRHSSQICSNQEQVFHLNEDGADREGRR